ncbi:MAG TPA: redoxin domain-containing protein [Candidatus Aquilonibacter sp.]|jgi:thiol-disulfide isomerase/thioredoxin|nr:redoxin domain-containing protein [Candidatus Aquilonibacter sp.]
MKVDKGKVRAPEIGRVWLNSTPLSFHQLRGRVVLVDFWDYTCVNCIRTLPYVQAWHERYRDKGLTVIGVHTPEFTFAQYESNVERGVREFGLTYPIVVDSNREIWKAFANRYWPTKYLLDKEGYLRYGHFGEGGYGECEQTIQELLHEVDPSLVFPELLEPLREEDHVGAVCYRSTGELYLGNQRGRIGNEGGFKEDQIADYEFSGKKLEENFFYASGRWASTAEYFEAVEDGRHSLKLKFEASAVNLVMAAPRGASAEVRLLQNGKPLTPNQAGKDTQFRDSNSTRESYIVVDSPRMYSLVDNHEFGEHELELLCAPGIAAFAFTFTSCVDPVASALQATSSAAS